MAETFTVSVPGGGRVQLTVSGPLALAAFSQRQRNDIMRAAIAEGANLWRGVYLPLRFSNYIRQAPWSYRNTPKYAQAKRAKFGHNTPLVWTGDTAAAAMSKAYVEARATAGQAWARVRLPLPGYAFQNEKVMQALRTVSEPEAKRVARAVAETVQGLFNGAITAPATANGPLRAAMLPQHRQAARLWVRPQRLAPLRKADRLAGRRVG